MLNRFWLCLLVIKLYSRHDTFNSKREKVKKNQKEIPLSY